MNYDELDSNEKTFVTWNYSHGILTFQLRYDFIHRVLMLHVIKANNLFSSVTFFIYFFY